MSQDWVQQIGAREWRLRSTSKIILSTDPAPALSIQGSLAQFRALLCHDGKRGVFAQSS